MKLAKSNRLSTSCIFAWIIFISSGCVITPKTAPVFQPTPTPDIIFVSVPPDATPTPTAFQPIPITPTSDKPIFPTATPTKTPKPIFPTSTPSGIKWAGYTSPSIPAPMPLFKQPPNQINILLMGSDKRPYTGGFRTDALILITVNFDLNTVSLTSFPRDLYVYVPGYSMNRINAVQFKGGFNLTASTFEYNFGVRPDHYALINFSGFVDLIDTLGGINVEVEKKLTDHRDKMGNYTVKPGTVHMDGETTLWYVRSRYTTSDFDRTRRQQEVLKAIFLRMLSFDLVDKFPQLYSQYKNTIQTDLKKSQLLKLIPLAPQFIQGERISRYAIGSNHVSHWLTYEGAQVLLPRREAIKPLLESALNIP
jgi:LCP family protein required for cell wall assembly